jgi:hypothetical protein
VDVEITDEFLRWYEALSEGEAGRVTAVIDALEMQGVNLREPYCKPIKSSRHETMHELRLRQKGSPHRILFCFDPLRRAILLIAGDKREMRASTSE